MKSSFFSLAPRVAKASFTAGFLTVSLAAMGAVGVGCSDDDKNGGTITPTPDGGNGNDSGTNKPTVELTGEVTTNTTLTADKFWLLTGVVFVRSGATLTIEKGTTIKGDNASKGVLVIQPGAKIVAEGTAEEPIVFTSQLPDGQRAAGDWGGLILLGNAPINVAGGKGLVEGITSQGSYGGSNPDDSSGTLRYVRVEYSGIELSPANEVNGVTFAGVGRGTTVDHIQVRHTKDDCFEFFGGTVNAKYLACQYNQDDGLDWDLGWQGSVQFFVLQQDPNVGDDSNGIEADNDEPGSAATPFSEPRIYNVTLCGQNKNSAKLQYGMLLRRNTKGHIFNSVAVGFEAAVDIRDGVTAQDWGKDGAGGLEIRNSIFFGSTGTPLVNAIGYAESSSDKNAAPNYNNDNSFNETEVLLQDQYQNSVADPGITGCFDAANPVFGPATSLTQKAKVPPASEGFDSSAAYIGAFKDATDTWATTGKWAVWKGN